jgi:hypothetical protein
VGRHNALHAVVFSSLECDQEEDATERNDGARTHTQKWVRRGEPRHGDLRLLESCETDEVEGRPTINQDVVHTDVGDGRGDDQRELLGAPHVLGAVRGIERDRRLHPLVVGHHSQCRCSCCHRPTQRLDDAPRRDVLGVART